MLHLICCVIYVSGVGDGLDIKSLIIRQQALMAKLAAHVDWVFHIAHPLYGNNSSCLKLYSVSVYMVDW